MTPHEHLIEETAKREKADERATAGLLALELMHEIRNPPGRPGQSSLSQFSEGGRAGGGPELRESGPGADGHLEPNFCKRIRFREVFTPAQVNLSRGGGRGRTPHSPKSY
jgi:hypothetical protein